MSGSEAKPSEKKGSPEARPNSRSKGAGKNDLVEFAKFGLVGVMNTAVDFLVFSLLIWWGVYYLAAQLVSYGAGTLNSYAVNKRWTFKGQGSPGSGASTRKEFLRFAGLNAGTLLLSMALLYGFKEGLGMPALWAKALVTALTVLANFAGSKLWVFRTP